VIFRLIFLACLAEFLRTRHQQIPQLSLIHTKSPKTSKQTPKLQKTTAFSPKTKHPGQISKELGQIQLCVQFSGK